MKNGGCNACSAYSEIHERLPQPLIFPDVTKTKKACLQLLANRPYGEDRIATESGKPLKTSTCASSGGSEFREKFRLNDVQTETKRGILEAFLTLNEQDRLEVLNVLEGVLKSVAR